MIIRILPTIFLQMLGKILLNKEVVPRIIRDPDEK